jgi:DNA-binding transcriptional ArsR family regulator
MPTKKPPENLPTDPADRHVLDYEIDDYVTAERPEQLKALADPTRIAILNLLLERAATTTHLAEALQKPKGTVGYHLNVLQDAGLIQIVRTRQVRAMTEKYYGRVGRTIVYASTPERGEKLFMLREAMDEIALDDEAALPMFTLRRIRLSEEAAVEFSRRIWELAEEYVALPRSGDTMYGFLAGIYPTNHPLLPEAPDES